MKIEEEVNLTGAGETNEGSQGKQEGDVQEGTCRAATRPGQWRKKAKIQWRHIEGGAKRGRQRQKFTGKNKTVLRVQCVLYSASCNA